MTTKMWIIVLALTAFQCSKISSPPSISQNSPQNTRTSSSEDLVGKWELESLNQVIIQDNSKPFLIFNSDLKKVSGKDGCNHIIGVLEKLTASEITIIQLISTEMACIGTTLPDEFIKELNKVTHYTIKNRKLILSNKEKEVLRFIKK